MVLTPRIAGTNLVPNGGGRYAANDAVPSSEYSAVNELNQASALIYGENPEFQYDEFSAKQNFQQQQQEQNRYARRESFDHFGRSFE